jgi:salicylate hydroxylase
METHQLSGSSFETVVLINGQTIYQYSDAAVCILRKLPFPWNGLSILGLVPRPLRDGIYRMIASNRYRWFGKRDTCFFIPTKTTE